MAKIDISKIDGYADMTPEQKIAALEAFETEDPDYSGYVKKDIFDKTASELAAKKKELNEKLTEDEQKKQKEQEEREELQSKYDKLLRESEVSKFKAKLLGMGYEEKLADATAEAMADGDTEKVFANQKKHLENVEKKVRAEALKDTPKPTPDGDSKTMTLEKLRKMSPQERDDIQDDERTKKLDLSAIIDNPFAKDKKHLYNPKDAYDFKLSKTMDEKVFLKKFKHALETGEKAKISARISNVDRALGTILGSEITKNLGDDVPADTFTVECIGSGGQSFGAFIPKGLTLTLEGDSNDYFGKGLSGGKLVVFPPENVQYKAEDNIIIGNVALYGATSGEAYINGMAGERFCVRNSGAHAVVEGVGDHGCEYMTGGCVVVLGPTGKNFAAGMSGGIAYVLDENSDLYLKLNKELVSSNAVTDKYDVMQLKDMIREHVEATDSERGKEILANFSEYLPKFKKIIPHDYQAMLQAIAQMEEKGLSNEQAQIEAFYQLKKAR